MSVTSLCIEALCFKARAAIADSIYGDDKDNEIAINLLEDAHDLAFAAGRLAYDEKACTSLLDAHVSRNPYGTDLKEAFDRGWNMEFEMEEMQACSNCQDGTGDPCRTHG
jgi:hypothetical protein